jgi:hypothetical protein
MPTRRMIYFVDDWDAAIGFYSRDVLGLKEEVNIPNAQSTTRPICSTEHEAVKRLNMQVPARMIIAICERGFICHES